MGREPREAGLARRQGCPRLAVGTTQGADVPEPPRARLRHAVEFVQTGDEDAGREAERGELPTESRDAAGEVVGADMDSRDELPKGEEAQGAERFPS